MDVFSKGRNDTIDIDISWAATRNSKCVDFKLVIEISDIFTDLGNELFNLGVNYSSYVFTNMLQTTTA